MVSDCTHPDFDVFATINRIEDTGRFNADIQIVCAKCKKKFRFIGLPMGLDCNGAAVSPDGTEGRFAIHPVNEEVPGYLDDEPAGFEQFIPEGLYVVEDADGERFVKK